MSVIEFKRKEPQASLGQWASGEAFCIACDHRWAAVAHTGTVDLECPNCKSMKGHWAFHFSPGAGQLVRSCDCGNQLFLLTPEGHMCANCGLYQSY